MKYVITKEQKNRLYHLVFNYLDGIDYVLEDDQDFDQTYFLDKDNDDILFQSYGGVSNMTGIPYRVLIVAPQIWDTVHDNFGIPHSELKMLFMEWFNNKTGEKCTTADRR
jgi:hypothetical protein